MPDRDAMNYFRAVAAAEERSERVLELTESIIRINPSHYTVWQYRFSTLLALGSPLTTELELMNSFARDNLKSYQVWHHRLLLMTEMSPDPASEIEFIHTSLLPDPKNYHTWAYLHWLYSHFSQLGKITDEQWRAELAWCDEMLADDGRNNSAWGWRWFLTMSRPGAARSADDEIAYAVSQIHSIPHNASAWNYLRGVVNAAGVGRSSIIGVLAPYLAGSRVAPDTSVGRGKCPQRTAPLSEHTPTPVPLALEFQADALLEEKRDAEAKAVFEQLATEADQMRVAYWTMRMGECGV